MIAFRENILGSDRSLANALVVASVAMALIGGAAAAMLPWWLILAMLLMPMLLVLGLAFPETAITAMFILICGLVPERLAPQISVGIGIIKAHEIAILLLFMLSLFRAQFGSPHKGYWGWYQPVLLLFALLFVGILIGKLNGASLKDALSEGRALAAWLILFIIVALVRTESQLNRLVRGAILVGLLVALALIAQFATGKSYIQNARVEALVTVNQTNSEINRSLSGGGIYFVVFAALLMLGRMMTRSISAWAALPALGLLLAGVVVTFGRGVWIASALAAILMSYRLARFKGLAALLATCVASGAVGLALLASFKPAVIEVAMDRVLSTTQETLGHNTSLGWRAEETRFAIARLQSSPITGIGFGVPYKPLTVMNGLTITESDEVLTRYIHNSYLGLWLKLGITGVFAAAWFALGIIRRGIAIVKQTKNPRFRALAAASVAAFLVPLIVSVTQPEWLTQTGIAFFALIAALLIVVHRIQALESLIDSNGLGHPRALSAR